MVWSKHQVVKNVMLSQKTGDRAMKTKLSGFTLIELMIVVVIVGVLAMIALPAYQDFIRKGRRADALTIMLNTQLQQEKWRANNMKYAATAASVGSPSSDYYNFAIVAATNSYTITATPIGAQLKDTQYGVACTSLTLNQNNEKLPTECWRK